MTASHPKLWKRAENLILAPHETTPFVLGGVPRLISFERNGMSPVGYHIRDWQSETVLASPSWSGIFGCAIVVNEQLWIFGATGGSGDGNALIQAPVNADWTPGAQSTAWQSNPACDRVWNSSVAPDPTGFIMVLETKYNGIIFLHAASIEGPWEPLNGLFNRNTDGGPQTFAAACPTIRYVNGWYYLIFAGNSSSLLTYVARSQTLATGSWQFSTITLLAPDGPGAEGSNASDWDHCEFGGQVLGAYMTGDQSSWDYIKTCAWPGTEQQMLESMFP